MGQNIKRVFNRCGPTDEQNAHNEIGGTEQGLINEGNCSMPKNLLVWKLLPDPQNHPIFLSV